MLGQVESTLMSIIPPSWSLPVNTVIIIGASVTGGAVFFLVSWTCLCIQLNRREKRRRAAAAATRAASISASPSEDKSFSSGQDTPNRPLIVGAPRAALAGEVTNKSLSGKKSPSLASKDGAIIDIPDEAGKNAKSGEAAVAAAASAAAAAAAAASAAEAGAVRKAEKERQRDENNSTPVADWERDLHATLFRKVPLSEVLAMTGNFDASHVLGEGAFAIVYRGDAGAVGARRAGSDSGGQSGGVQWAIKRSKRQLLEGSPGALGFEREVLTLSRLAHRNLVRLLGYCIAEREHILVYELAENGSLGHALKTSTPHLSFSCRVDIALGAAEGLHYLHSAALPSVVHRDVKPDNILLDKDMAAKVADFGLLRDLLEAGEEVLDGVAGGSMRLEQPQAQSPSGQRQRHQSVYTRVAGTPGYLDPEYHLTSKVTVKGDVYSFGVVLLELFTGRKVVLQKPQDASPTFTPPNVSSRNKQGSAGVGNNRANANGPLDSEASMVMASVAGASSSSMWVDSVSAGSRDDARAGARAQGKEVSAGGGKRQGNDAALAEEDESSYPVHITQWAEPLVQAKSASALVDPRIADDYDPELLLAVLNVAVRCVALPSRNRPEMGAVVRALAEVREKLIAQEGGCSAELGLAAGRSLGPARSGLGSWGLGKDKGAQGSGGTGKGGSMSGSVQEQLRMWAQLTGDESTSDMIKPPVLKAG